jgi:cleavage stimulation factor subunit 3
MELELDELKKVERIFERSITGNPHVGLWSTYINYIRRVHNVTTDEARARPVITSVYEFVLAEIGIDIHSGKIWQDYLEFIKSGPGGLGVNNPSWQDMQKADSLRKVYQRAIAVPTNATLEIWREYDKFELNYFRNNNQGRKNLQDHSPYYMQARTANNVLEGFTRGINRTTMPKLPPVQGFDGYDEYMQQIKLWKHWIQWEKDDPLVLKDVDRAQYNKRVLYLYKQALMALRFWPELWYEAAEWCFENSLEEDGEKFLAQGIDANPESCLLAFKQAHQIELKGDYEDGDAGAIKKGAAVRAPFDKVLAELYELTNKTKKREEQFLARAKEAFAAQQAADEAARATLAADSDDDEDDDIEVKNERRRKEKEEAHQAQLKSISAGFAAQTQTLKKTLTYAWIALMRAMRRIQGKGRPDPPAGQPAGFRGIFAESRKKGKLLSDAYVASALIEHHCYQDPAATKIFERGLKLFPDDEHFALEYIKHLIKINDLTSKKPHTPVYVLLLTLRRCSRSLRDSDQPANIEAGSCSTREIALCVFP